MADSKKSIQCHFYNITESVDSIKQPFSVMSEPNNSTQNPIGVTTGSGKDSGLSLLRVMSGSDPVQSILCVATEPTDSIESPSSVMSESKDSTQNLFCVGKIEISSMSPPWITSGLNPVQGQFCVTFESESPRGEPIF